MIAPHADPTEQPDNRWPAEQHQKGKALLNVSEELAQWRPVKQDFHFYSHLPAENQHMSRKVFRAASIQAIIPPPALHLHSGALYLSGAALLASDYLVVLSGRRVAHR